MPTDSSSYSGISRAETEQGAFVPGRPELRANPRYEVELEFDLFHLWGDNHLVWAGSGRTLNWSRNSVLISYNKPLTAGSSVEMVVRWCSGVQLVVVGRVLSSGTRGTVVRMVRRRFRGQAELTAAAGSGATAEAPKSGRIRAS
jgi:hypothetical protein